MLNKTIAEVSAEVRMLNTQGKYLSFLILEGTDDVRFWNSRVHRLCALVDATGKSNAIGATARLNAVGFVGHVSILDRDYAHAREGSDPNANQLFWDSHSLETVLFNSSALERVVGEHIDAGTRETIEKHLRTTIKQYIESIGALIGAIRNLLFLSGRATDSDVLSPFRHIDGQSGRPDPQRILAAGVTAGVAASIPDLQAAIAATGLPNHLLARGHDLSAIISIVIQGCGGSCSNKRAEELLRIAFHQSDLEATALYADIRTWEHLRSPARVLPENVAQRNGTAPRVSPSNIGAANQTARA